MKKSRIYFKWDEKGENLSYVLPNFENDEKLRIAYVFSFLVKSLGSIPKAIRELNRVEEDTFSYNIIGKELIIEVNKEKKFTLNSDSYPEDSNSLPKEDKKQLMVNSLIAGEYSFYRSGGFHGRFEIKIAETDFIKECYSEMELTLDNVRELLNNDNCQNKETVKAYFGNMDAGIIPVDFPELVEENNNNEQSKK